jgi:drug/metabolite transporter (DMT)-like permease
MTGVLWAASAGTGFGLFQTANRAAVLEMDVFASTFVQLVVSAVLLAAITAGTGDLFAIGSASGAAVAYFAAAGLVHFLLGWTLLNASQKALGATRTSPLIATTPLFGTAIAALTLHEVPSLRALGGVALIIAGVYGVEFERLRRRGRGGAVGGGDAPRSASLFGLGSALCWAISPILIREGLQNLASPLAGVTVSLVAAALGYGVILAFRARLNAVGVSRQALGWKLVAGVLVGLSTWTRWYALSLVPVAVVLGLSLLSVPTVLVLAPVVVGRQVERVTVPLVAGAALVVAGAAVVIVR